MGVTTEGLHGEVPGLHSYLPRQNLVGMLWRTRICARALLRQETGTRG